MLDRNDEVAAQQVTSSYRERKTRRSPVLTRMGDIHRQFYGEIIVPLPELDEAERPAVPNLIAGGIKQIGMKTAEVMPRNEFQPVRPGIEKSRNLARERGLAVNSWWDMNWQKGKLRRRGLHLAA